MSRIFSPVDKFPLPDHDCMIDVKLVDGSVLICAAVNADPNPFDEWDFISIKWDCVFVKKSRIVSWREHEEEITIDWPTESGFSFGSDE